MMARVRIDPQRVTVKMAEKPTSYVGRPGSKKDLFPVYVDGHFHAEMGSRNSYGFRPGGTYQMDKTADGDLWPPGRAVEAANWVNQ